MKTVFLAWEVGAGLGHAANLKALGDRMALKAKEAGTDLRLVYALNDPVTTKPLFDQGECIVPAPRLQKPLNILTQTGSYSDMLATCGFAQVQTLSALVEAWENLIGLVKPDLIVAEASPAAALAAPKDVPVVITGNGFYAPPANLNSYPPLRIGAATSYGEGRILDVVNAVQKARKRASLDRLPQLGEADLRAVFTLPQLDPYTKVRTEPVQGHYVEGLAPSEPPDRPSIFYYGTANELDSESISGALMELGVPVSCYIRGRQSPVTQFLKLQGAKVYEAPPDLRDVISQATMVVSHGTGGLTHAAMMVGRPHAMMPTAFEPLLNATQAQRLGVGKVIDLRDTDDRFENTDLRQEFADVLASVDLRDDALAHAHYIKTLPLPPSPLGETANSCLNLLGIAARP